MTTVTLSSFESLQQQGLAVAIYMHGKDIWRLTPRSPQQVAKLLHWAQENEHAMAMNIPDAVRMPKPIWLDLSLMKQVRQYPVDDFIIQVESGMTYGALSDLLAENRQMLPLSYPAETTISEILALDWPALETGFRGYPRDSVLKIEIATPDGNLTISGADVVKNVTGYDLHKLYVGGRHTFGVITSVTFKLTALPPNKRYWLYPLDSVTAAYSLTEKVLAQQLPISICEIYQENQDWRVLIEAAGDPSLLLECETRLLNATKPVAPRSIGEKAAKALTQPLQIWPDDRMVIEFALPLGKCAAFKEALLQQNWLKNGQSAKLQIRPAAGLFYIIASSISDEALNRLYDLSEQHQGFMQILQWPIKQKAESATWNLPQDPSIQRLLKTLKTSYDPNRILFTPSLPI